MGDNERARAVAAVAALDEPTRRRLYDHVVRQPAPVSRDEAAEAVGVPRTTVAFHLDRLVGEGLLEAVHERLTGRSGPGAGRPAKLYRRSPHHIAVSLPERRYELIGDLLADALQEADASGEPPRAVLHRRAREFGRDLGLAARAENRAQGEAPEHDGNPEQGSASAVGDNPARSDDPRRGGAAAHDSRAIAMAALEAFGFEPRVQDDAIVLGNCPFHRLAQRHTELVCGANACLLDGLLDGLAVADFDARLAPSPGHCCVRLDPVTR